MTQRILNKNSVTPNDGLGDKPPVYTEKINDNFTELYNFNISTHIVVNQANLPETLGAAIDSSKVYVIDGIVDFTGTGLNVSVPSGGINIIGSTFDVSKLICSDINYTMFDSEAGGSGNVLGMNYAIEVTGSGSQVYDIIDATGFNAFEFTRVNYNNCTSLGTIDSYRQGLEDGTGRFGGSPCLTLKGSWIGGFRIVTSITRNMSDTTTDPLFKAGAGFTMGSRFLTDINVDLGALQPFIDFAPANMLKSGSLQLSKCIISRNGVIDALDTNILPNIDSTDLEAEFKGNTGITNTHVGGIIGIATESTTTISTTGVFYDADGTWGASDLSHFDHSVNGQIKSLGDSPTEYRLMASLVIDGNPNKDITARFKRWNSNTAAFEFLQGQTRPINSLSGGRDVGFFAVLNNVTLNKNDYLQLQVANETDTSNVTIEVGSFVTVDER